MLARYGHYHFIASAGFRRPGDQVEGQNTQGFILGDGSGPVVSIEITGKLNPACVAEVPTLAIVLLPECDDVH